MMRCPALIICKKFDKRRQFFESNVFIYMKSMIGRKIMYYKVVLIREGVDMLWMKEWLKKEVHQYYIQELDAEREAYVEVVSNYIDYYNSRAFRCKMLFYGTNFAKIVGLAGITFVKVIEKDGSNFSTVAAVITTLCLVLEGAMALFRWQEKWILYRNAQNALMKEKRQFAVREGIYSNTEDYFSLFVMTVEGIIDDEARKWNSYMREQQQKNEDKTGGSDCDLY